MSDVEKLNQQVQQALINGDTSALSFISELGNDTWVKEAMDVYHLGFFGFTPDKGSRSFSYNGKNDAKLYQDIASAIVSKVGANNTSAYHINDEAWLVDKLTQYKNGNIDVANLIPDLIIVPEDISLSNEVNNLIVAISEDENIPTLPIRVKYVSAKTKDDEDVIYMGDIIKYDDMTNSTYIDIVDNSLEESKENPDKINEDFLRSLDTFSLDMGQSKTSKLVRYYKAKCDDIGRNLDEEFGRSPLEDAQLYTKDSNGNLSKVNMDLSTLRINIGNGTQMYDENGSIVNYTIADIERVNIKNNRILSEVLQLYAKKDKYTFNHIDGMRKLIPLINDGLAEQEKLSEDEMRELDRMVILHDVGKLAMPLEVLSSPGKLNKGDRAVMNGHILEENVTIMRNSFINSSLDKALMHHDYVDKKFEGVKRDRLTEMLSVLDVYNALTADRSYKQGFVVGKAYDIMADDVKKGKLNPEYLEALLKGVVNEEYRVQQQENEETKSRAIG